MSLTTQTNTVPEFLQLIDASTLSESRKLHWMHKIGDGEFTPADSALLSAELDEQIARLDSAIEYTEGETDMLEQKQTALKKKAAPSLQAFVAAQPQMIHQEQVRYQNSVLEAEKQMSHELEGVRVQGESSAIDALRKKLAGDSTTSGL